MRRTKLEWKSTVRSIARQEACDQCEAIRGLADDPSDSGDLILLALLDHPKQLVREEALEALAKRSKEFARVAARAALEDSSELIRCAAAEILGEVGKRIDSRRLRLALDDSAWIVRSSAADSLGRVGGKAARPALVHLLWNDPHPIVRRDAAYAISFGGNTSVASILEEALISESSEQGRLGILEGLYALGKRERLSDILALLLSDDYQVQHAAMNAIAEVLVPADREDAVHKVREILVAADQPGTREIADRLLKRLEG